MTWVKICGLTNEEDALLAVAMGADALGFIFAQGSKRQVQAPLVADIVKRLPPDVTTIGVFRNELPERVVRTVERCGLSGAQLHGRESAEQCIEVASRIPLVIKAFAIDDPALRNARRFQADTLLIDAPSPGSGETFDWSLLDVVPFGLRWVLAGGLHPGNVAEAIRATQPWGVDVASGVEQSPGHKDPRLVREFIKAAKAEPNRSAVDTGADLREPGDQPDWGDPEFGHRRSTAAPFDVEADGSF
jgi:phosphoribosylanthranilate isomerase